MFKTFVLQAAFLYFRHAVDVIVAPTDDTYHIFSFDGFPVIIQGCHAQCAGWFHHNSIFIVKLQNSGAYFPFVHQLHFIQHFPANIKCEFTYSFYGGTIYKTIDTT